MTAQALGFGFNLEYRGLSIYLRFVLATGCYSYISRREDHEAGNFGGPTVPLRHLVPCRVSKKLVDLFHVNVNPVQVQVPCYGSDYDTELQHVCLAAKIVADGLFSI